MAAVAEMMKGSIWFDRSKVEEAEYKYQEYLVRGKPVSGGAQVVLGGSKTKKGESKKVSETGHGKVAQQIAEARQKIQESLKGSSSTAGEADVDALRKQIENLTNENKQLKDMVTKMTGRFEKLESRLSALESGSSAGSAEKNVEQVKEEAADNDDDDSDDDLFASDNDDDREEMDRIKAERLAAYQARKEKKPAVIAKSNIILDIKPWDDETDMAELEKCVRSVQLDGLLWGASKLVKVAFGIMKLQITSVVEDDKVGTDMLEEELLNFEDYIQSVDIVAFNKI